MREIIKGELSLVNRAGSEPRLCCLIAFGVRRLVGAFPKPKAVTSDRTPNAETYAGNGSPLVSLPKGSSNNPMTKASDVSATGVPIV